MNTREQHFNAPSHGKESPPAPTRRTRHPVAVAIAILAAVLLVAAAQWTQPGRGSGQHTATPEVKAGGSFSAEFDYFPDQYINQAKEPEEHVQAF